MERGVENIFSGIAQQLALLWPPNSPWGAAVGLLDLISILAGPALWLSFMIESWRTAPSKEMLRRYSFKMRMQWLLPFYNAWRKVTSSEHVVSRGSAMDYCAISLRLRSSDSWSLYTSSFSS
jgi:hypothetical protein